LAVNKKLYDYYYYYYYFLVFRKIGNLDNVAAPIFLSDRCNYGCPFTLQFHMERSNGRRPEKQKVNLNPKAIFHCKAVAMYSPNGGSG